MAILQEKIGRKKNLNKPQHNSKKQEVCTKEFREYVCNCSRKCHLNISVDERKMCNEKLWELGKYNTQTVMLGNFISLRKKMSIIIEHKVLLKEILVEFTH